MWWLLLLKTLCSTYRNQKERLIRHLHEEIEKIWYMRVLLNSVMELQLTSTKLHVLKVKI